MKIVRVRSNIKSPDGKSWSHELGKLNLLVGPNESGKSAIAEAVQLAVSGSAYGLFFRNARVKTGNQLINLATTDEPLFAEVEYEDGSIARWVMAPGTRPSRIGRNTATLPVAELRDALGGSATKARKFFAEALLEPISRKKFEKLLEGRDYDLSIPLDKIIPDYGNELSASDILKALDEASSWKRKSKAEAKAGSEILSSLGSGDAMEQEEETQALDDLCKAVRFEWVKKGFKDAQTPEERIAMSGLALSLGSKAELKALDGSAQVWERLREMWMQEAIHRALKRTRTRSRNSELAANEFEALEKAIDAALHTLLKKPLDEYCRRVNKFLPKGDKFTISHTNSDFRVCLVRGTEKHYALSGSAEARTLAAMGSALSRSIYGENENAIIILDDRMWDATNLSRTMERLEKSTCQVILMSTFKPRGRARAEWNYVEVSRKENTVEDEEAESKLPTQTGSQSVETAGA